MNPCFSNLSCCSYTHSQEGLNYPWLNNVQGGLDHIEFQEPAPERAQEQRKNPNSVPYKPYTIQTWQAHCKAINHSPSVLIEEHLKAFVYPQTRFAKLRWFFKNGAVVESDLVNVDFFRNVYQKEAAYYAQQQTR